MSNPPLFRVAFLTAHMVSPLITLLVLNRTLFFFLGLGPDLFFPLGRSLCILATLPWTSDQKVL